MYAGTFSPQTYIYLRFWHKHIYLYLWMHARFFLKYGWMHVFFSSMDARFFFKYGCTFLECTFSAQTYMDGWMHVFFSSMDARFWNKNIYGCMLRHKWMDARTSVSPHMSTSVEHICLHLTIIIIT